LLEGYKVGLCKYASRASVGAVVGTSLTTGAEVGTSLTTGAEVGTSLTTGAEVGMGLTTGAEVGTGLTTGAGVGTGLTTGAEVGTGLTTGAEVMMEGIVTEPGDGADVRGGWVGGMPLGTKDGTKVGDAGFVGVVDGGAVKGAEGDSVGVFGAFVFVKILGADDGANEACA
jgi:hypothetical protein